MAKIVLERSAELDFEHIVEEIVTGKLAANIYRNAKTIYPIRRVEIRKTEVLPVKANASAAA
ncbi:30S ribosomal protein S3AE [Methanohalophilus portucalensis FDF-1]|nr:30S ribosomal protein S3AE [Methanohalophilus portucalensis FDF-1]